MSKKMISVYCFLVLLITFLLIIIEQNKKEKDVIYDNYIIITDALNREVCVKENADKIIVQASASGGAFMTIVALKGDDFLNYIVGIDDFFKTSRRDFYDYFCKYFPEIEEIEEVGTINSGTFSIEQAISLNADVVIVPSNYYSIAHDGIEQKLEEANIPIVYIDYHEQSLEQHINSTRILGKLLNEEEKAEQLIDFYESQILVINERLQSCNYDKPTIYVEVGRFGPKEYFNTFGNYMWGKMVEQAGALNVMRDIKTDTATASSEWVLEKNPDIILIIGSYWPEYKDSMRIGFGVSEEESIEKLYNYAQRDGWENLTSVKNGKVYSLHHAMIREMYDFVSLQQLAKICYPDLFSDIIPENNLKEYFKCFLPIPYSGVWMVKLDEQI